MSRSASLLVLGVVSLLAACGDDGGSPSSSSGGGGSTSSLPSVGGGNADGGGDSSDSSSATGSGGDLGTALVAFFAAEDEAIALQLDGDPNDVQSIQAGLSAIQVLPIRGDCPAGVATCVSFTRDGFTDPTFLEVEPDGILVHVFAGGLGEDEDVTTDAELIDEPGIGESAVLYRSFLDFIEYGTLAEDGSFVPFVEGVNVIPAGSTMASYDAAFDVREVAFAPSFEEGAKYSIVTCTAGGPGHQLAYCELADEDEACSGFSSSYGGEE